MVTLEPNCHTTGRFDHPKPQEAEENGFKCNFMRMMERPLKGNLKMP